MQLMHLWFCPSIVEIILIFVSQHRVLGQSIEAATWIYPTRVSPRIYNYVDSVNATWSTEWPDPWLRLWCTTNNTDPGNPQSQLYHKPIPTAGSRLIGLDYGRAYNRCHFELTPTSATGQGLNSANFDINEDFTKQPVIWGLNSTTTSSTSSPAPISTSTSAPISTIAPNSFSSTIPPPSTSVPASAISSTSSTVTQPASSGLSVGATGGIALAGSASVLGLAGGAFYLIRRRRRRRRKNRIWSSSDNGKKTGLDENVMEEKDKKEPPWWRSPSGALRQLREAPVEHQELDGAPVGELQDSNVLVVVRELEG